MDYNEIISKGKQVIKSRIDGEVLMTKTFFLCTTVNIGFKKITNIGTIIHIWPM